MIYYGNDVTTSSEQPNVINSSNDYYEIFFQTTGLLISLSLIKQYLRLDPTDTQEDEILTHLHNMAISIFEANTKRTIRQTSYKVLKDDFSVRQFALLRSPFLQPIGSFKYFSNNVLIDVPVDSYYLIKENEYYRITMTEGICWPSDSDNRKQAIQIMFDVGYEDPIGTIPDDIISCLLKIIQYNYENRGDCPQSGSSIPNGAREIIQKYKIYSLLADNYVEGRYDGLRY